MYTVSRLARRSQVTADTVRHYVQIGLLKPQRNPHNGYKLFTDSDVSRLIFIRQAQCLGFTLSEIREILDSANTGESPCPRVREILNKHIEENRHKVRELLALQQRMEAALELWSTMPDSLPTGNSICRLIESLDEDRDIDMGAAHSF